MHEIYIIVEKGTSNRAGGRRKGAAEEIRSSAERRGGKTERNSWAESWEVQEEAEECRDRVWKDNRRQGWNLGEEAICGGGGG